MRCWGCTVSTGYNKTFLFKVSFLPFAVKNNATRAHIHSHACHVQLQGRIITLGHIYISTQSTDGHSFQCHFIQQKCLFFCNKANVVFQITTEDYCFTKWGRGFLFLSDDFITFFIKTVPHKRIQTQIQRIRRQWWCVQWWNDICTHAIIITVKSSQFHGSLKNVNGTVQKPLANIFIADSNV